MELKEIQELIKFVAKSGVSEVSLENKGFKLVIKTGKTSEGLAVMPQAPVVLSTPAPMPATAAAPAPPPAPPLPSATPAQPPAAPESAPAPSSNLVEIRSPMIGTFYRRPGPDKPPFVNVGDEIKKGQVICVIEAMKLFNEIEAEMDGKIVKVLVDDASPVEYNQPLFLVEKK
ncbi:MAG: acetyl-CoA carboxylase biotin carboxyl carrier protein [Flavobacteriales bacterium]|nr:acetyl-CoA carboxylase biotin carboxyl carrier protein [Flavobacteriales bacterium]